MKILFLLICMLVLVPVGIATNEIIDIPFNLKTLNGVATIKVENAENTYSLNCSAETDITQTLKVTKDVQCAATTECEEDVDTLYSMFKDFTKQFNQTLGGANCVDILVRNKELIRENANLKADTNTTENNWYNLYTDCNGDRIRLEGQAGYANDYNTCKTEKEKAEKDKVTWGIIGLLIGFGIGYLIWGRIKTTKSTNDKIGY